ncbi:MAG: hypothetical protein KDA96_08280 [Planctomycetaceae bacterium]|nr:hypothetical protein [Planctomycetaceae bacterium]
METAVGGAVQPPPLQSILTFQSPVHLVSSLLPESFASFLLAVAQVYFRFVAALTLVVAISMASVLLEKHTLEMRRAVSRQYYHTDLLLDLQVNLRLQTQQLTAPAQLEQLTVQSRSGKTMPPAPENSKTRHSANSSSSDQAALPLLRFRHPFRPEGID